MPKTKSKKSEKKKSKKDKGSSKIYETKTNKNITTTKISNFDVNKLILKTGKDIENYLRNYTHETCLADNLLPKRKTAIKRKNNKYGSINLFDKHDAREIIKENRFIVDQYLKPNFKSIIFVDKSRFFNIAKIIHKINHKKIKKES